MRVLVSIICVLFFISSCYYDKEELLYTNDCDTSNVTYSVHIEPIINTSCATVGCHVQGGSGVGLMENYTQVKSKVDDGTFSQRVLVSKDMPPSAPLNDCQLALIQTWLDAGAPNN